MGGWIYSFAASWTLTNPRTNSAATRKPESASIAFRASIRPPRAGSSTTTGTAPSPTSARNPASPRRLEKRGVSLRRTSTTTAGWTFSWRTTRSPIFSSSTSATENLLRWGSKRAWHTARLAASATAWALTRLMSGWGVKFFDYDNDGNLDLFIANGHPDDKIEAHSSHVTYKEPLLLFHNNGRSLENVSSLAGPAFTQSFAARGMAVGDFNNDGAVDVLVSVNGGSPVLLKNVSAPENHWLGVRLVGKKSNPDAIGARITWQAGDQKRSKLKVGGGSYLSSHDPREVLGIGKRKKIDSLEIRWPQPSGRTESFTDLPIDRYVTIVEGSGIK